MWIRMWMWIGIGMWMWMKMKMKMKMRKEKGPLENTKGRKWGSRPAKLRKKYGILLKKLGVKHFLSIFAP